MAIPKNDSIPFPKTGYHVEPHSKETNKTTIRALREMKAMMGEFDVACKRLTQKKDGEYEKNFPTVFYRFLFFIKTLDMTNNTLSKKESKKETIAIPLDLFSNESEARPYTIALGEEYQNSHALDEHAIKFLILWDNLNSSNLKPQEKKKKIENFFTNLTAQLHPKMTATPQIVSVLEMMKKILISLEPTDYKNLDTQIQMDSKREKDLYSKIELFLESLKAQLDSTAKNLQLNAFLMHKLKLDLLKTEKLISSQEPKSADGSVLKTNSRQEDINDLYKIIETEYLEGISSYLTFTLKVMEGYSQSDPGKKLKGKQLFDATKSIDAFLEHNDDFKEILNLIDSLCKPANEEIFHIYNLLKLLTYYQIFFAVTNENEIDAIFKISSEFSEISKKLKINILKFADSFNEKYISDNTFKLKVNNFLTDPSARIAYAGFKQSLKTTEEIKPIICSFADQYNLTPFFLELEGSVIQEKLPPLVKNPLMIDLPQQTPTAKAAGKTLKTSPNDNETPETPIQKKKKRAPPKDAMTPIEGAISELQITPMEPEQNIQSIAVKKASLADAMHSLKSLENTKIGYVNFKSKPAAEAFKNAIHYMESQKIFMREFFRKLENPEAKIELMDILSWLMRSTVAGNLGVEGLFTAYIAEHEQCRTNLDLMGHLSHKHDLIELIGKNASLSNKLRPSEWKLVRDTNLVEIHTRDSFKLRNLVNPQGVSALLSIACEGYLGRGIDRFKLIKKTIKYFCTIQENFHNLMRLFPSRTGAEELDEDFFSNLYQQLCDQCAKITFSERKDGLEPVLADAKSAMIKLKKRVKNRSFSIRESCTNLEYLISFVNTMYKTRSTEDIRELGLTFESINHYTHIICEKFCYLLCKINSTNPNELQNIGHDLKLLIQKNGLTQNDFSEEELDFIKKHTGVYARRYDTDTDTRELSKLSKSTKLREDHPLYNDMKNAIKVMSSIILKVSDPTAIPK